VAVLAVVPEHDFAFAAPGLEQPDQVRIGMLAPLEIRDPDGASIPVTGVGSARC
jgi:hypothetical protein